ncbi:hypothetical protein R1flu_029109 [Riccia fluitans]|uniref:Secreted protein n=1 Tax=Riccia fluitans TaxID=41844 RepID=A0ABD1XNM8_9MARC
MVACLFAITMGHGAAVGSGILTTACVTSTAIYPDVRSTIGPSPIVARIGSSVASLAGLPILNDIDLNSNFLDRITGCQNVIGDSSSVISSS